MTALNFKPSNRIPCCVPFCKRTAPRSEDPDQEIICGPHIRPVSKRLRAAHKRLNKHVEEIMDKHPEPDDLPVEAAHNVLRLIRLSDAVWQRIKRHAIETAGGIR